VAAVVLAPANEGLVDVYLRGELVSKIARHSNPIERPVPSFMLRAALDDVGGGAENFEQLWTKRVGDDLFELSCIPFFAYELALGDVVRADEATGYVIQGVVERSGNGVVRVAVPLPEDVDAIHRRLHDLLGRLEYLCEWFAPGYVAVSVDPGRSHEEFFAGLAELGDSVEIERILI
jgi:hypothetical protein